MRYCALLAVLVLSMFVVGCDDPPQPDDPSVYDKKFDGEPSIYSLDAVIATGKSGTYTASASSTVDDEAEDFDDEPEVASIESAVTEKPAAPANPFAIPPKPVKTPPASVVPTPPVPTPAKPETPPTPEVAVDQPQKDVLKKMALAIRAGNETEFMEYVYVQKAHKPFIFGLAQSLDQFNTKMKKTYGADAIEGSKSDLLPSAEEIDDKIEITVAGNSAIVKMQGQGKTLRMLKQKDKWVVDLLREIPLSNNAHQNKAIFKAVRGAIAQAEKKIGKSGYTADRINDELENDMMGTAAGAALEDQMGDVLKKMKIGR